MAKTPFKRRLRSSSQDETKGKQVDIIQVRPRRRAGPEEEAGLEEEEAPGKKHDPLAGTLIKQHKHSKTDPFAGMKRKKRKQKEAR